MFGENGTRWERISRSWRQAEVPDERWLTDATDAEIFLKRVVRRASYGATL